MRGKINWYDESSGRGSIIGENNVWYRIHEFTQIDGILSPNTQIIFTSALDSIHPIVKQVKIVK